MAPEQVEGGADIDARTDIYALGAMAYENCSPRGIARGLVDAAFVVDRGSVSINPPPDPPHGLPRSPPRRGGRRGGHAVHGEGARG